MPLALRLTGIVQPGLVGKAGCRHTFPMTGKSRGEAFSTGGDAETRPLVFTNARLATLTPHLPGLGIIEPGVLLTDVNGRIVYAGPTADAPTPPAKAAMIDCDGRWITPGLIDCHTHLVHAGNRANEFEMRLAGASYEEVARAGGGIVSSVRALRQADEPALVRESLLRLDALIAEGVTTVEVKSGYGLDLSNERKSLRAARALAEHRPVSITTTFLGAHALPPEAMGDKDAYIDLVCDQMIPALAAEGLVDAVDGFCESIAFTPAQIDRVFAAAQKSGLPVKLHADQLSNSGGAALAARHNALSADHVEYTDDAGAQAMAATGTVAVLLPGAFYFIREKQLPPVESFRHHRVAIALATDCNPGTSPLTSLLLTMNMGATLFRLTVEECIAGVTRNAAQALGLQSTIGTLEPGKWADLAIWDIGTPAELVYRMGFNPLHRRIWRGR
jgi:imidazolonepropionase